MSAKTRQSGERIVAGDGTTPADGEVDAPEAISKDDLFHLLQNSRRRGVIRYLKGRTGPVRMRDVAEQVAAWEHDTTLQELTSTQRQRVYIALYQSHLETLDDAGVVGYDKARGVVEPGPLLERVAAYVDVDEDASSEPDEPSEAWDRWYLGVSILSLLFLAGAGIDAAVLQLAPGYVSGALVLLSVSLVAVATLIAGLPAA